MIVVFPDKDFPHITVRLNTDTMTAMYVHADGHERPCTLTAHAWRDRLIAWKIDLPALMDYYVDEGL